MTGTRKRFSSDSGSWSWRPKAEIPDCASDSQASGVALCVIAADGSALDHKHKTAPVSFYSDTHTSVRLPVVSDNGSAVFSTWAKESGSDCRDYSGELEALLSEAERNEETQEFILSTLVSTTQGIIAGIIWLVTFVLVHNLISS